MLDNNNLYWNNRENIQLIDDVSETEIYIGVSKQGNLINKPVWQINKLEKIGTVWNTSLFPNGNQDFVFIWDNRTSYTYS
jgi:hypothetical protein